MRTSIFDYIGNLDTLLAVMVGALLATAGALVAELIQDRLGRRRRARDAARFFGEIMASMDQVFDLGASSMTVGERWGSVTQRLFDTALREAAVYERNRERLFDINDMSLRFAIHGHMLRFSVPLASLVEYSAEIDALRLRLDEDESLTDKACTTLQARIAQLDEQREGALEATQDERKASAGLLEQLETVARLRFEVKY